MFTLCSCRFVLVVLLLTAVSSISSAQTTAGLNGPITDATGAVTPNARVTVTNAETGIQREAASDAFLRQKQIRPETLLNQSLSERHQLG